jgi:hypothetical protein
MRKILIIIFLIQITSLKIYAQGNLDNDGIKRVKIYAVEWDIKSKFAFTIDNFKTRYSYYFEIPELNVDDLFMDYNECVELLSSQKTISSDSAASDYIRQYVELRFYKRKTIKIYFDIRGNYYFKNKWHVRQDGLYYNLFRYFSDVRHKLKYLDYLNNYNTSR